MKRTLLSLALCLGAATITHQATAQSAPSGVAKGNAVSVDYVQFGNGKTNPITILHSLLPATGSGVVTITLPASAVRAVPVGTAFLSLPRQAGLRYDLRTLTLVSGALPAAAPMAFSVARGGAADIVFTCKASIVSAPAPVDVQQIFLNKL